MPCPKCGGINFVLGGKFKTKMSNRLRQRLRCKDCKTLFIVRNKTFKLKIPFKIRNKILSLYRTKKPYKNKFDCLHKSTYSTREIAKMMDVSKSFVYKVIKDEYTNRLY